MSKLGEILGKLAQVVYDGAGISHVEINITHSEAEQQIKALMLEIIGEDDWTDSEVRKYQIELRQKVKEL